VLILHMQSTRYTPAVSLLEKHHPSYSTIAHAAKIWYCSHMTQCTISVENRHRRAASHICDSYRRFYKYIKAPRCRQSTCIRAVE